jgi:hypothetical protein
MPALDATRRNQVGLLGPRLADAAREPDVALRLVRALGFERKGKDFWHPGLDLFVEFPGPALQAGEQTVALEVDGTTVLIVSPEDLILDRLRAFVHWRSLRDGLNVVSLLRSRTAIDRHRVSRLARKDGLATE